jgi:hypothetical protein
MRRSNFPNYLPFSDDDDDFYNNGGFFSLLYLIIYYIDNEKADLEETKKNFVDFFC